jgi:hypothetical protein
MRQHRIPAKNGVVALFTHLLRKWVNRATTPFFVRLFDVLDLFPQFFDLHLDIDGGLADSDAKFVETGGLG